LGATGARSDEFTLGLLGAVVVTARDWERPASKKLDGGDDTTTDGERPAIAKLVVPGLVLDAFLSIFVDGV
jgi:hypothetical protein